MVFLEHRPRVLISVARDVGMNGKGELGYMLLSMTRDVRMNGKGEWRYMLISS